MRRLSTVALVLLVSFAPSIVCAAPASGVDPVLEDDRVRAIVREVLADAASRTSLSRPEGAVAGHDGVFFLSDRDGDARLELGGMLQSRYVGVLRDDGPIDRNGDGDVDDPGERSNEGYEGGFIDRRARIKLSGRVHGLDFRVQSQFSSVTGALRLLDVGVKTPVPGIDGLALEWGQFVAPFNREFAISPAKQLAVDRSIMNSVFSVARQQGVQAIWSGGETLRGKLMLSDGSRGQNTPITRDRASDVVLGSVGEGDAALTGRIDWRLAGDWARFADFSSAPGSEFGALVGVAGHAEFGTLSGTRREYVDLRWTADLSLEGDAWNAHAAIVHAYTDVDGLGARNDLGLLAQGGVILPETDWEIFMRWDAVLPDGDRDIDEHMHAVTAGGNWFIVGHIVKFTIDAQVLLTEFAIGGDSILREVPPEGILATGEPGSVALRAQFQLVF